jgi:hypothetical protein
MREDDLHIESAAEGDSMCGRLSDTIRVTSQKPVGRVSTLGPSAGAANRELSNT